MNVRYSRGRVHARAAGVLIAGLLGMSVACGATSHESTADDHGSDDPAAERDVRVPDVLSELGGDRFAGLEMHGQHIVSYWVGTVPAEARDYAESEPEGMTIELVTSARFSRDELTAAAERIVNSEAGGHAAISWVSAESDGSGLEIAVEGEEPSPTVQQEIAALAGLPENAIAYTPNTGPIARAPATVASPPPRQDG